MSPDGCPALAPGTAGRNVTLSRYLQRWDFSALHAEYLAVGRQHAGILLVHQQRYSTGELIRRLLRFAFALSASEMVDRAEYLSAWEPAE